MIKASVILIAGAALSFAALPAVAQSQTHLRGQFFDPMRQAPPLTITKRPFTDSGTAVPVGYESEYLTDQTTLNEPVYSSFNRDGFGQDVLPRRFDGLGLN